MNYAFLINNRTCIGCHACSTACKAENQVPLGVHRTWVKYVERGVFPTTRRHFQVTRCNHCANPPCVRICPVQAMYQRADGIVDFDPGICIGCKACMQACPYDAIHIDPSNGTAAKCHYCAHRVEVGLEPACVTVCPEQAIVAGDLDDPDSRISRMVARNDVTVRRPEQGTAPKLFYIEGDAVSLTPTAATAPGAFAFAEVVTDQATAIHGGARAAAAEPTQGRVHDTADVATRTPGEQGGGAWTGPLYVGHARLAEQMVQTAFSAQHLVPWHWPVPAYLVTKAVGAGVVIALACLALVAQVEVSRLLEVATLVTALAFTGLTAVLLVLDLERPERFLLILTRPQWSSWLTRGTFILIGYSVFLAMWLGLVLIAPELAAAWRPWLLVGGSLGAALAAAYTAWLLGQAEGRDLWQSPQLPLQLLLQAVVAGAATMLLILMLTRVGIAALYWCAVLLGAALALNFVATLGEIAMPHGSEAAAEAAVRIRRGPHRRGFWWGAVGLGHVVPLVLVVAFLGRVGGGFEPGAGDAVVAAGVGVAGVASLVGLWFYERAFIQAPQEIPNS